MCWLKRNQESSSLRESALLGVKTSVWTRATIIKAKEMNCNATCTWRYMEATICGSEPLHKAVLIRVQTFVLRNTLALRLLLFLFLSASTGIWNSLNVYRWEHSQDEFIYWMAAGGEKCRIVKSLSVPFCKQIQSIQLCFWFVWFKKPPEAASERVICIVLPTIPWQYGNLLTRTGRVYSPHIHRLRWA